jgi:hypothetical protein
MMRYAEHAPDPPRDHAAFESFIRELDAGCVPLPLEPEPEDDILRQLDCWPAIEAALG